MGHARPDQRSLRKKESTAQRGGNRITDCDQIPREQAIKEKEENQIERIDALTQSQAPHPPRAQADPKAKPCIQEHPARYP